MIEQPSPAALVAGWKALERDPFLSNAALARVHEAAERAAKEAQEADGGRAAIPENPEEGCRPPETPLPGPISAPADGKGGRTAPSDPGAS